jgi:hypothetical protein
MKRFTILADTSGAVWLESKLDDLELRQIIKEYERRGVYLSDYYSLRELEGGDIV